MAGTYSFVISNLRVIIPVTNYTSLFQDARRPKEVTIAIKADGLTTEDEMMDHYDEQDLIAFNDTTYVDMMDIDNMKQIYKEIHMKCEEIRSETKF